MTREEYDEALKRYREKFGEPFPLYMALGMEDEKIVEIISECVESGKEYDPEIGPDIQY